MMQALMLLTAMSINSIQLTPLIGQWDNRLAIDVGYKVIEGIFIGCKDTSVRPFYRKFLNFGNKPLFIFLRFA